ncbi:FMN-linked oxidoreductase [Aspergillus sclerotioniger CBS 115572]|uniref:FMN-linked oxidoreductase n=1 Tax=Aspergillus sclerotioniger CBS 115572 TaxID=1450535 RepID=A0A317X8C0_9EURO|nr:FMN-linked oxidoreductase [Aspergillus sclerotioniger CBS 115572]PWY94779.1 FMN-linked oxidoreductase [Aspergillus sclerotioniger CBS 115572]
MSHLNIAQPLTLRCGLTLPNRVVKAAMAEGLADKDLLPGSKDCLNVYGEWSKGGWGLVISGNVQVDPEHLGGPGDFAVNASLPESRVLAAFTAWASASQRHGTKAVVQLCHPGRQIAFNRGTVAPSAVPMDLGDAIVPRLLNALVFGTPREMTVQQIQDTVRRFAEAARVMAAAGFAGVELHAAHGYLLTQFLSRKSNLREDEYGGDPVGRARIVVEILQAIRAAVPTGFCVGIKLNSVDVGSAVEMGDCIQQLRAITEAGTDFLEVSGGSFEDPSFSTGLVAERKKASTLAREAFFVDFAQAVRAEFPHLPLLLTGGFRSRRAMEAAVKEASCDLVGLARPSVMDPLLPRTVLLNRQVSEEDAMVEVKRVPGSPLAKRLGVKLIGVGPERDWYTERLQRIGAIKSSIVVTGTAPALDTAIVRSMFRRPNLARNTYGLYVTAPGAETHLREGLEASGGYHEILTPGYTDLAGARRVADSINQRVAIGSLPSIQALVLHEKDEATAFLLSLLLLQSIEPDRGRIIVVNHKSRRAKDSDTMLWCSELSERLAVDPALSNITVAVVDQACEPVHWFEQTLLAKVLMWLVSTLVMLLWPGTETGAIRRSSDEVVRVLADDRNGVWLSSRAVSGSDVVDVKQRREAWRNYLVTAKVKQGDTALAKWQ